MNRKFIRGSLTGGLLVALSLTLPADTLAQRSGVEIWAANCGRCHIIQPTNKYDAAGWVSVGQHMAITSRLTSAEADAVIAFLISGARTVEMEEAPQAATVRSALTHIATTQADEVKTLYESLCAPCHGVEGKGEPEAAGLHVAGVQRAVLGRRASHGRHGR
jgi:cytochrome c553